MQPDMIESRIPFIAREFYNSPSQFRFDVGKGIVLKSANYTNKKKDGIWIIVSRLT